MCSRHLLWEGERTVFEQWRERELAAIREQYGKARLFTYAIAAFMGLSALGSVVMLLDGGGAAQGVALLFQLAILAAAWALGDYKRRFIKPLLASVEEVLPTQGEREEFARQMEGALRVVCPPGPQVKACPLWMGADYSYYRRPGKSRVWKNRDIRRARLARESYTVGRGHVRTCYGLYLFEEGERSVWNGCFRTEEEAYGTLETMRGHLPANLEVDDRIAYGKTEEGRRADRRSELIQLIVMALVIAVLVLIVKRL